MAEIDPVAEIFKPAFGYEGNYEVSNKGTVKSINRLNSRGRPVKERVLKQIVTKYGYCTVHLSKNGITKTVRVHRLVAKTFIKNEYKLPQVNHIDENKQNNNVENLEWISAKDNSNHGSRTERSSKRKYKKVISMSEVGLMRYFNSIKEAAKKLNLEPSSISAVLNARQKLTKGYKFFYANL